jgi:hypothetical protein
MTSRPVDIEVPFRGRSGDPGNEGIGTLQPSKALHRAWDVLPYPVAELLAAPPGPFRLEVEVKHDDRVVGTWCVECTAADPTGVGVSQVRAALHVCGSAAGNPRECGAFLAIGSWWVDAGDPRQVDALYARLGSIVIERLASLLGNDARERSGHAQPLVLYLLDVRRSDRRSLSLATLQDALLLAMAGGHAVAGVDLKVAHGAGLGTAPTGGGQGTAWTPPLPLTFSAMSSDRRGEVFIRETVSPANVKWNRRASDRPLRPITPAEDMELTIDAWPTTAPNRETEVS